MSSWSLGITWTPVCFQPSSGGLSRVGRVVSELFGEVSVSGTLAEDIVDDGCEQ